MGLRSLPTVHESMLAMSLRTCSTSWIAKTGKIIKKVPLSGRPNDLAVTKDGRRVLVCIHEDPGALDVIDTTSLERVKSIPTKGGLHNGYVTPDGKYAVVGAPETKFVIVIDLQTEQPVWDVQFDHGIRTMAIESGPDGSTSRIFVNLGRLNGFAVVDFATHEEVARIKFPDTPSGGNFDPATPSHGIGVAPDGKTLWINSAQAKCVFVYSLPDLKLLGHASTGDGPDWLTFAPDSKMIYVSNSMENSVSVICFEDPERGGSCPGWRGAQAQQNVGSAVRLQFFREPESHLGSTTRSRLVASIRVSDH